MSRTITWGTLAEGCQYATWHGWGISVTRRYPKGWSIELRRGKKASPGRVTLDSHLSARYSEAYAMKWAEKVVRALNRALKKDQKR